MSLPSTMKAILCTGPGKASVHDNVPIPNPPSDYILVKIHAVALNPTDWKHIHLIAKDDYNHLVGCDYAGEVVSVGEKVTKTFQVGERVMGFVHGLKHEDGSSGAFAEYAKAKGDIQIRIPDSLSWAEAASMPTGINTVGQSLYESMGLPWPDSPSKDKTPVLIYGGSTATGMYAIKYAKLSGMFVITTCSGRNFEKCKRLGADAVFDYRDAEAAMKSIKDLTKDNLKLCMDCVSSEDSAKICAGALASDGIGTKYRSLLPLEFPRKDVECEFTLGYSAIGEEYSFFGNKIVPTRENFEFAKKWWALAEKLIGEGRLTPADMRVGEGGLHGVLQGLDDLKEGRVSGEKLVYKV